MNDHCHRFHSWYNQKIRCFCRFCNWRESSVLILHDIRSKPCVQFTNSRLNSDAIPFHWILRKLSIYFKQVFKCFPDYRWIEENVYSFFWNESCMKLALQSYSLGYVTTQYSKTLSHQHKYLHCSGPTTT